MSRSLSTTFKAAINANQTGEIFLSLLTITHDDLDTPIRIANNNEPVTSNGNVFTAYPFGVSLPNDNDEGVSSAKLMIDNVNRDIIIALRQITSTPNVLIQIVLASDPDTVEIDFDEFEIVSINYNVQTIEAELSLENFMAEPYPWKKFTPSQFSGMFA